VDPRYADVELAAVGVDITDARPTTPRDAGPDPDPPGGGGNGQPTDTTPTDPQPTQPTEPTPEQPQPEQPQPTEPGPDAGTDPNPPAPEPDRIVGDDTSRATSPSRKRQPAAKRVGKWAKEHPVAASVAASAGGTALLAAKPLLLAGKGLSTLGGGSTHMPTGIGQVRRLFIRGKKRRMLRGKKRRRRADEEEFDLEEAWDEFFNDRAA
jgi:hypothetical protein